MERLSADWAVGVDLGKTHCRVTLFQGLVPQQVVSGPGLPGAAAVDGAQLVSAAILNLLDPFLSAGGPKPSAIGVGAAGILTAPAAADAIAQELADRTQMSAAVTSDVITAHVGAFGGGPGTVLVVGTGAVAVTICDSGKFSLVDGWGPGLGDLGGGAWLGRHGLRAVLEHIERAGPFTTLADELESRMGPGTDPVRWVNSSANPARTMAQFAPAVLDQAQKGDPVAGAIAVRAIEHLVATASAALLPTSLARIVCLGGLTSHPWFWAQLITALIASGVQPSEPLADADVGAQQIATRFDLPHERLIHRA